MTLINLEFLCARDKSTIDWMLTRVNVASRSYPFSKVLGSGGAARRMGILELRALTVGSPGDKGDRLMP